MSIYMTNELSGLGESESQDPSRSGGQGRYNNPPWRPQVFQQQGYEGRGSGPAYPLHLQQDRGGYYQGQCGEPQPRGRGGTTLQHLGAPPAYQGHGVLYPRGNMLPNTFYGARRSVASISGGSTTGPFSADQSRMPAEPELHQASEVPVYQITQPFLQLSVQGETTTNQSIKPVVGSSKNVRFPLRPGKGSIGTKCLVKANHFLTELPNKDLHQYDVAITPEVTSRGVNRAVMKQLVSLYRETHLGGRLPAYDGRKSLYTAGPLPFTSKEFIITLIDEDDGSGSERRQKDFKIVIKLAARANLHRLELFLAGKQADAPHEALQVLDIVLRELPTAKYCPVGRSFYSPDLGAPKRIGEGLESWRGFYQSIRPTEMGLSLNIDMTSTAFIEPLPIIDFVTQIMNNDLSRPLSDSDRVKIRRVLKGIKVEVTHRGNMRRKYRICGLTSQSSRELTFKADEKGTMKSVEQYFQETYGFAIQNTNWPCLLVGNQQRPNYLPMEVCRIVEGQRYSKRLNDRQITALLKVTCQRPHDRELDVLEVKHFVDSIITLKRTSDLFQKCLRLMI